MLHRQGSAPRAQQRRRTLMRGLGCAVWTLSGLVLAGCILAKKAAPAPSPLTDAPSPTATVEMALPTPTTTPGNAAKPITLTLWLPPEMVPSSKGGTTGQVMAQMNQAFMHTNPRIGVKVIPKAPYGPGGLAHMLLATHPVVPARMPDIVAIDASEARELVEAGVLGRLDKLIPEALWEQLFAFAVEAGTVDGDRYLVPFQTDISFLVYNSSLVKSPPPLWENLTEIEANYIFPAGEGDGSAADAFLLQYLARGGDLGGQRPHLDSTVVAEVLTSYRAAVESGVVPETVLDLRTLEECWAEYVAGDAGLANTSSWLYQRDRAVLKRTRYAQIPTGSEIPITLARCWAWAIATSDPVRQKAAARYIAFALRPQNLSSWARVSFHLPTHRPTLPLVVEDEAYCAFLERQLQHARPYPDASVYAQVQEALMQAVAGVLGGVLTPERAAVAAAALVARLR